MSIISLYLYSLRIEKISNPNSSNIRSEFLIHIRSKNMKIWEEHYAIRIFMHPHPFPTLLLTIYGERDGFGMGMWVLWVQRSMRIRIQRLTLLHSTRTRHSDSVFTNTSEKEEKKT
jgi:hypothetical protein